MSIKTWFFETRPSFLLLTPLNFFVGLAVAYVEGSYDTYRALLGLIGIMLAHIAMNVINDYFDYSSGLDLSTTRTPFSGGSGVLPTGALKPRSVYIFAITCLILAGAIGVYFAYTVGWEILPVVLFAALIIYTYTNYLSHWYVGEFFTGLNYGFLIAVGAYFIMTGRYNISACVPAVIPGILGATLLYINEFPDIGPDRESGRRNVVMLLGLERASKGYAVLVSSIYFWVLICVITRVMTPTMLVVILSSPIGYKAAMGAMRNYGQISKLVPSLAANVQWIMSTTLLTIIGILTSAWI